MKILIILLLTTAICACNDKNSNDDNAIYITSAGDCSVGFIKTLDSIGEGLIEVTSQMFDTNSNKAALNVKIGVFVNDCSKLQSAFTASQQYSCTGYSNWQESNLFVKSDGVDDVCSSITQLQESFSAEAERKLKKEVDQKMKEALSTGTEECSSSLNNDFVEMDQFVKELMEHSKGLMQSLANKDRASMDLHMENMKFTINKILPICDAIESDFTQAQCLRTNEDGKVFLVEKQVFTKNCSDIRTNFRKL